ncbi:MAG TPA: hypothetical protein VFS59_00350 [Gemmatimonadaceae bacterium]|nr:hypothetical protein [Gemmatimonadaceae bacterium]
MSDRSVPRALAWLERILPDDGPLVGDLLEEFERRQSYAWLWWQVLGAMATRAFGAPGDIRPLRLVDDQPVEAMVRTHRWRARCRPVNLSASPISDVGGIGLLLLTAHLSVTVPGAWVALLVAMIAGVGLGAVLVLLGSRSTPPRSIQAHMRAG